MKLEIAKTLVLCALMVGAGALSQAAQATEFDTSMEPILTEYLKIHTALAADHTDGVAAAARRIEGLAEKLDPARADESHAQHYRNIPKDLIGACQRLRDAKDIDSVREAFKQLSMPVSMWVTMARPQGMRVMYCPMKKAGWVQEGAEVANPYYGAEMLECGYEVGESR